ncbi:MAG: cache domain-containing protein, partial [Anaerolineales bacterium]|nr:cache domain-containing protein [Anaerolineales bacterium]
MEKYQSIEAIVEEKIPPKKGVSIKARLLGMFISLSCIIILVITLPTFFQAKRTIRNTIYNDLNSRAIEKKNDLDYWTDGTLDSLELIANQPVLVEKINEINQSVSGDHDTSSVMVDINSLLGYWAEAKSGFTDMFLLDPESGIVIAASSEYLLDINFSAADFYKGGMSSPTLQNPGYWTSDRKDEMVAAAPI